MPELPEFPFVNDKLTPEEQRKQWESQNPSRPSVDQVFKSLGSEQKERVSPTLSGKKRN
jgi:hypothetical protein